MKRTVVTLLAVLGCASCGGTTAGPASGPAATPPAAAAQPPAATGEDGHAHEAPHGGSLVELGEEFAHLEVVLDDGTGRLTVYVLDGEAERPVRLAIGRLPLDVRLDGRPALPVALAAVANTLTGETVGDSSQFQAVVPELKGVAAFSATVASLGVRGQTFTDVQFDYPAAGH